MRLGHGCERLQPAHTVAVWAPLRSYSGVHTSPINVYGVHYACDISRSIPPHRTAEHAIEGTSSTGAFICQTRVQQ